MKINKANQVVIEGRTSQEKDIVIPLEQVEKVLGLSRAFIEKANQEDFRGALSYYLHQYVPINSLFPIMGVRDEYTLYEEMHVRLSNIALLRKCVWKDKDNPVYHMVVSPSPACWEISKETYEQLRHILSQHRE